MRQRAIVLANDFYRTVYAKTTHGLVRGPSRFEIASVVDATCAGADAGELLDGRHRGIPIHDSVVQALERSDGVSHCLMGVANPGGVLTPGLHAGLVTAARAGLTLVNGLHSLLSEDPELVRLAAEHGGDIFDIRKPPATKDLHFWSGRVLELEVPRVAVLGTDCALGKRTTCGLLRQALADSGVRAEMVYTGQTGWLQGYRYGFIFDATPNDFVCGELEHAILSCAEETSPDVILLEGQSSLRNPSGPCGAELILSGAVSGVFLQHAPGRRCFEGLEEEDCRIPSVASEIELIRMYGSEVWAVGLHTEGLDPLRAEDACARLEDELGLPVVLPLADGAASRLASITRRKLGLGGGR